MEGTCFAGWCAGADAKDNSFSQLLWRVKCRRRTVYYCCTGITCRQTQAWEMPKLCTTSDKRQATGDGRRATGELRQANCDRRTATALSYDYVIILPCYHVIILSCYHIIMLTCYHVIMLSCYHVIKESTVEPLLGSLEMRLSSAVPIGISPSGKNSTSHRPLLQGTWRKNGGRHSSGFVLSYSDYRQGKKVRQQGRSWKRILWPDVTLCRTLARHTKTLCCPYIKPPPHPSTSKSPFSPFSPFFRFLSI